MNGKSDDSQGRAVAQPVKSPTEEVLQEIKPLLRPDKVEEAETRLEAYFVQETHQGPLPSARELAKYDACCEGAAERIIAMAEREQTHRHSMESTYLSGEGDLRRRGQIFALLGLGGMLGVISLLAVLGFGAAGAWLGGTIIVAVVASFIGPKLGRSSPRHSENADPQSTRQTNSKGALRATHRGRKGKGGR